MDGQSLLIGVIHREIDNLGSAKNERGVRGKGNESNGSWEGSYRLAVRN